VFLFTLRLSFSGRAVHRASATRGQEAFLDGHVYAFDRLGGVPAVRIRYDNLKSAVSRVLFGRSRVESARLLDPPSRRGGDLRPAGRDGVAHRRVRQVGQRVLVHQPGQHPPRGVPLLTRRGQVRPQQLIDQRGLLRGEVYSFTGAVRFGEVVLLQSLFDRARHHHGSS
jgi:hypothetical protein